MPADPSSAAFPLVAALIVPGSDVVIEGVMTNPLRTGLLTTLREMGADIAVVNERIEGGESVADLRVRAPRCTGVEVPAGARAVHDRRISGAGGGGRLRHGHHADARPLRAAGEGIRPPRRRRRRAEGATGVAYSIEGDDLLVEGAGRAAGGGPVATHMDHRIAMSFLVMGLATDKPVAGRRHLLHRHQLPGASCR